MRCQALVYRKVLNQEQGRTLCSAHLEIQAFACSKPSIKIHFKALDASFYVSQ
jgi:hypothetical protein